MVTSKSLSFFIAVSSLTFLFGSGFAQRPTNASVCDFYAQARYGANSSETQLKFIQNVVCLAFEGGSKLNNVSSEITGILRPGKFNGINIDLLQYFNGSKASTNVNNAPIGINWLDQGGTSPLAAFLAGESQTLKLESSSNQYHLFSNFFVAFSRAFGCTLPPAPLPNTNGPVGLAYAHKFMNLEYHQLGYFINQLSLAATHFGLSPQDADTFRTTLNSRYNVRCAPAVSFNPSSPAQLLSLCQNPTCPLAVPVSDCAAYTNLTANGAASSNPTTATSFATKTVTPSATGEPTSSTTGALSTSSSTLSTGGIAGVAIGGAAVLLAAIVALVYFCRRRRTTEQPAPTAAWDQQNYGSPAVYPSSTFSPKGTHLSYYSTGQPPSEMDTARFHTSSPTPLASPNSAANQGNNNETWRASPVEMDGTLPIGATHGPPSPPQQAVWSESQRQGESIPIQNQDLYLQRWGGMDRHSGV